MAISLVQDGFTPAKATTRPRPTPRGATLGDFVSRNSFQALSGETTTTTTTAATVARRRPTTTTTAATTTKPIQTITRDDEDHKRPCNNKLPCTVSREALQTRRNAKASTTNGANRHNAKAAVGSVLSSSRPAESGEHAASPLTSLAKAKLHEETFAGARVGDAENQTHTGASRESHKMGMPEFERMLQLELANATQIIAAENHNRSLVGMCVTYDENDDDDCNDDQNEQALMAVNQAIDIEVAIDSGSVVHVANPDHLPAHAEVVPNTTGRHFNGANASHIENYGTCLTSMQDKTTGTLVDCDWSVAEVVKPLHAVCKITGTPAAPKHDVLFTAGRAVVVPHGHVESILRNVKPLMQYDRQGDLFVAKLTVSGFTRQGAKA